MICAKEREVLENMSTKKFFCGMGMGMVAGVAAGMLVAKQKKKLSKGPIGKAMKTIGSAVEDVVSTLGL